MHAFTEREVLLAAGAGGPGALLTTTVVLGKQNRHDPDAAALQQPMNHERVLAALAEVPVPDKPQR